MIEPAQQELLAAEVMEQRPSRIHQEDMVTLKKWVKERLFRNVKFIHDPEINLQVTEVIYKTFVRDRKQDLRGLRGKTDREAREIYCESLWQEATRNRRKNVVMDAMSDCRSTVYSAAANRFMGK